MDEYLNDAFMKEDIDKMMACLTPRQRQVIGLRYDLDNTNGEMRTLEEIGRELCVTRERIRQIEEHAFTKIRSQQHESKVKEVQTSVLPPPKVIPAPNHNNSNSFDKIRRKYNAAGTDERNRRLQNKIERIRKTIN